MKNVFIFYVRYYLEFMYHAYMRMVWYARVIKRKMETFLPYRDQGTPPVDQR